MSQEQTSGLLFVMPWSDAGLKNKTTGYRNESANQTWAQSGPNARDGPSRIPEYARRRAEVTLVHPRLPFPADLGVKGAS